MGSGAGGGGGTGGGGDELHSSLIMYFRIFAPLTDDHVIASCAADIT
jgi:hypothetical protein